MRIPCAFPLAATWKAISTNNLQHGRVKVCCYNKKILGSINRSLVESLSLLPSYSSMRVDRGRRDVNGINEEGTEGE
ncbi:hypothetical protein PUN28_008852 [Cardiocondyla obscurior]|uniref:Uncharacterized protein n=1 Tax=Cardiocondyla obscurior TaxID=286306 RepID=A0AAW2FUS1_9HYME